MKTMSKRVLAMLFALVLLAGMIYLPPATEAEAVAAYEFYGDYTDVAKIYDYNGCPSIQGLAVGSQKLYTIKTDGNDYASFISMTDKDSGTTEKLYNGDTGSYMFYEFDHANDMDVWGIDGYSNLFVATTKKGASAIVRLRREGSYLYKVGEYHLKCDGEDICSTAMSIMSVSNGEIKLLTKWGMDLYTGTVSASATNATINMTKICTLVKSQVYIKDTYNDLSSYVNQGMGYHNGMVYLPISGDDSNLNRSVILVYNIENASGLVYPIEHLSFRVTSSTYSALFELESCDICSADGKLYFAVQRRKTTSDTNHDGVAYFNDYTFSKVTSQTTHYTVEYDANGGEGTMKDTYVSYGYKVPLRTNTFTRNGYSFAGWAAYRHAQDQWYYTDGTNSGWYAEGSQPEGYTYSIYNDGVTVAKSTAVDNDTVTMYAQWTPLAATYTIKYDANGGTGTMEDTEVVYGYNTPLRKNTFTRSGYSFVGWTAYRTAKGQWYYTNGTDTGWYVEGSQPDGYYKSVYKDEVNVAKTTSVDGDIVYMYAQWEQNCANHGYTAQVTTAATCTTTGVMTYTCSGCGDSYTEEIPAAGHSYTSIVTNPTCTSGGYTTYTCSGCGDSYIADETASGGHSYTSVVTKPTCTSGGYTTYTCTVCGDAYIDEPISATGHSYTSVVTKPTCTAGGYTTYTCSACGDRYTGNETAATGHNFVNGSCTDCGESCDHSWNQGSCTVCGMACTHNWVNGTCTACGQTCSHKWFGGKCTECNMAYPQKDYYLFGYINGRDYACNDDYLNLGEYKFVNGKLTAIFTENSYVALKSGDNQDWYMSYNYVDAGIAAATLFNTNTGAGEKLFVPGGKIITFTLVSNGDDSFTLSYTARDCTHDSHGQDGICTTCGASVSHSYQTVTNDATCTAAGSKVHTCTVCGYSYSETIAAPGHSYGSWTQTKAPTCTESGELKRTCSACGDVQTQSIATTDHSYVDGTCTNCGAADPDAPSVIVPTLNLDHPSLSFEGEIMYNLYFTADDLTSVVEMGLISFNEKLESGTIENADNIYPGYITAGSLYMGQSEGVPARYLGDAVYFKAYAKLSDGSYVYSGMAGYNAAVYAKSILNNSTNDYMKRLVVAMINYGAEAQGYFCGKEGVEYTPMNNFLTADQQALINAYDASMVADLISVDSSKIGMFTYNTGDFTKRSNSVSFDGAFAINYYFTAKGTPDNGMKFYYWNTADYEAADVLTPENATGSMDMVVVSGNQYWGQVSGIAAKEVDHTYFVAGVYELDGVTYTTGILAYSLGKYCARLAAGTTDQQALSAATAVYGYYAKEYFANI